jgi:voltage-gated potassium channel
VGTFSRLRVAFLLVVLVIVTGVLGYRFVAEYPWFDALYMTIITLTTVGFFEVHPLSPAGRGFTMVLLVAGLGIVFYTVVTLAESVVEGEFQRVFGRRRMEQRIAALRAHYVVCGFGRIGEVVCRELGAKPVPFVVIEHDAERVRTAEAAQYLVLHGDATHEATLLMAGVQQAQGLFAALPTDSANVFVTLTAKELNPRLQVIVRAETEHSVRILAFPVRTRNFVR